MVAMPTAPASCNTRHRSAAEVRCDFTGAGASAGLSSLYYPSRERSFTNTGTEWGLDVAIDSASFVFKEFWPDINHKLFHAAQSTDGSIH